MIPLTSVSSENYGKGL
ncbi:unnamed protein product [Lathyrus oleraceus]